MPPGEQAERGVAGSMEGHAGMDMSVQTDAPFLRRLFSRDGLTSTSQYFVMDWAAVLRDIVIGLLIAGAFAAWVPTSWLKTVFLADDPTLAFVLGPLIGPLIAVVSFVCSVGNVPLAAVLWNGGISFGGVMSFIFADLIIIPILLIYRRYYGTRAMLLIAGVFYLAMAAAGYIIELLFTPLGLIPHQRHAAVLESTISWNYTTWLNIVFLAIAAALLIRFYRSRQRTHAPHDGRLTRPRPRRCEARERRRSPHGTVTKSRLNDSGRPRRPLGGSPPRRGPINGRSERHLAPCGPELLAGHVAGRARRAALHTRTVLTGPRQQARSHPSPSAHNPIRHESHTSRRDGGRSTPAAPAKPPPP